MIEALICSTSSATAWKLHSFAKKLFPVPLLLPNSVAMLIPKRVVIRISKPERIPTNKSIHLALFITRLLGRMIE